MENSADQNKESWLDKTALSNIKISWEIIIFGIILLLAVISRFYDLGARVISHDETSHVYYAWRLFRGMGYSHDPITHGPFQFHFLALIYFLLGDSDYTARIPAAITGVITILFLWKYRRYLGSWGTLAAALMFLISPFMLYYSRYVRNESFSALFGVVTLWAILRYLETSSPRFLYWLTAATVLHFTTKETAFIYTAQAMVFLGLVFVSDLTKRKWEKPAFRKPFLMGLILAGLFLSISFVVQTITPEFPIPDQQPAGIDPMMAIPLGLVGIFLLGALYCSIRGFTWKELKQLPSFSALLLLGTLVLPQLAPFPANILGMNSLDYSASGMLKTGVIILIFTAVSITVGLLWNRKEWLINAAIFYIPFTIFYTTVFTNGTGFFTGLVGSLGYWLNQQVVERGSQPWYYYWLIQIPIYEYLPALGGLATVIGVGIKRLFHHPPEPDPEVKHTEEIDQKVPVFALLAFWSLTSLIAYPIAGEKMPWLTVHIAFPLILLSAWGFQKLMARFDRKSFSENNGWVVILLILVFLTGFTKVFGSLLSTNPPFQGQEMFQLRASGNFIASFLISAISGYLLWYLVKSWKPNQFWISITLSLSLVLVVLTTHTAVQAAFINYDDPTEYLVYAHGGRGIKEALAQIEELSYRTSDGLAMEVAFDNETTYPYWWYLRNYDNQRYYAENPTRDLRNAPVILVGNNNYAKLEPVVGSAYYEFTYNRIVWPNQDYYNLTWERIGNALTDPALREGIFRIWLLRDYQKYAEATNKTISLANWSPADQMKLYVRKDIAARVWNYGSPDMEFVNIMADPYEGKELTLDADINLDQLDLLSPRNVEVAPDGTLFVLDTGNHQVLHLSQEGEILNSWGGFGTVESGTGLEGTFNEPWGIAISSDGFIFIADTWNHRIQKFTMEGEFVTSWGKFGQRETPDAFWGPRDVAVDKQGHVYVSDTGNKRVVVFDLDGQFLAEFGDVGMGDGQFDEPSGLALDDQGNLYVADTWNQRIQVFSPDINGVAQNFVSKWNVEGWYGQSLDNKPYLTIGADGNVYVSDPELSRILVFEPDGEVVSTWGTNGEGLSNLNYATGLSADEEGGIWVSDTKNNRLLHFLPTPP
jgi:predicted membrane-bound mannosyltransferase/DNA-binding beta-propeller fold protein YncE